MGDDPLVAGVDDVSGGEWVIPHLRSHGVQLLARSGWLGDLPAGLAGDLAIDCRLDLLQTTRLQQSLPLVAAALQEIPWVVLKGPVLDDLVYPRPGLRTYADLDVLVRPRDLEHAVTSLERAGAHLIDRNLVLARRQRRGEVDVRLPGGAVLDLHWHVVNDPRARRQFNLRTDDLVQRRQAATVGGCRIWRLDDVDFLAHLVTHALTSGANRLIWAFDLRFATEALAIDPGELSARGFRLGSAWDVMVRRAAAAAGFDPGPRLARRTLWSFMLERRSRRQPLGLARTSGPSGRALYAATRASTAASVAALASAWIQERREVRAGRLTKAALARPADAPEQRTVFFRWVREDADARRPPWARRRPRR